MRIRQHWKSKVSTSLWNYCVESTIVQSFGCKYGTIACYEDIVSGKGVDLEKPNGLFHDHPAELPKVFVLPNSWTTMYNLRFCYLEPIDQPPMPQWLGSSFVFCVRIQKVSIRMIKTRRFDLDYRGVGVTIQKVTIEPQRLNNTWTQFAFVSLTVFGMGN